MIEPLHKLSINTTKILREKQLTRHNHEKSPLAQISDSRPKIG